MSDKHSFSVPKWPFFLGDAVLLGIGAFIYHESARPLGHWEIIACGVCAALGALLGVLPFVLDYRALSKALEVTALGTATEKIQNLERLATQISSATNHWENVQLQAEKISGTAGEIAERMSTESREFTQFLKQINEGEKSTLRLEVEKLRRAEGDWLQVLVHLLDHIYALHSSAMRSGQPQLIEQLTRFQNACRHDARRVGLLPFTANVGDPFDAERHRSSEAEAPAEGSVVGEILAPGYTLQGRLIRPTLVRLKPASPVETAPPAPPAASQVEQDQLPLETSSER